MSSLPHHDMAESVLVEFIHIITLCKLIAFILRLVLIP
jgi:hypothetical protein